MKTRLPISPVREKLKAWVEKEKAKGRNVDQMAMKLGMRSQTFRGCLDKETISAPNRTRFYQHRIIDKETEYSYLLWCKKHEIHYSPIAVY